MAAYYNEFDKLKAEVLREAIKAGAIAPGDVDERSIEDVDAADLVGYTQCHFFAGGGFWSLALRYAGWPDDRPVWTGSCPCPSFSAAGKGGGFDDPRHLWPAWAKLIRKRKPPVIFGEQADDAVGYGWLDLVQTDLEAETYAVGKIVFGACSVGAPHIRQRLYFVADSPGERYDWRRSREACQGAVEPKRSCNVSDSIHPNRDGSFSRGNASSPVGHRSATHSTSSSLVGSDTRYRHEPNGCEVAGTAEEASEEVWKQRLRTEPSTDGKLGGCTDASHSERWPLYVDGNDGCDRQDSGWQEAYGQPRAHCQILLSSYSDMPGTPRFRSDSRACETEGGIRRGLSDSGKPLRPWRGYGWLEPHSARLAHHSGATRSYWADCDWWYGGDDKYRPIGPGLFPLAHGSTARVGRLRLYGDGIVVQAAQAFIEAYLDTLSQP